MRFTDNNPIKIAILDLYEGAPNQGMRCIRELINQWGESTHTNLQFDEFEVRINKEIPSLDYDIFISSGGPGSPLDTEGSDWEKAYFEWLDKVETWNNQQGNFPKKNVLFICHSFQLACRYYGIGTVCKRKSTSFGVFPIHMLMDGMEETVFEGLRDPFYAVDSRDYQVIEPNHSRIKEMGAKILAIEKNRPHVPYERAIMALRFNPWFIGTQFHPEADAIGMSMYLQREDKKQSVIENHGEAKWANMLEHLQDPEKIMYTYSHIIPNFLQQSVGEMVTG
jgi:homoserine O-succinyltransferase/O-acetyltransferase